MIIVLIHAFYLLGKFVFHRYFYDDNDGGDANENKETMTQTQYAERPMILRRPFSDDNLDEESKTSIKFSPPAYIQRYQAVEAVLTDTRYGAKLKKIVDFGCSELGFCLYLKKMVGVEEALFVDIDKITLEMYKEKTKPLHVDYLHRRSAPLVFRVVEGSVTQQDKMLENCDAVVCIELIEHLYPETLTQFPFNIFGFIRPKVAVVTTPNADFNVLFDNMKGFRHPDHKFEWTRQQFQDWAHNIVSRYPEYLVTFHGIGNGPPGTESFGACSQMAVFHKNFDLKPEKVPSFQGLYQTIVEYEYPYEIDNRSDEEKILDDAVYYITNFSTYNEEESIQEIALQKLLNFMNNYYCSIDELKEILQNAKWTIIDRQEGPVVVLPQPDDEYSDQSIVEDEFLDNDIPEYQDWEDEPGPPDDYFNRNNLVDDTDVLDQEDWDNDPHIILPLTHAENYAEEASVFHGEIQDSTSSIYPEQICLDDIITESRSIELANSTVDESILLSSFSETRGSENSETAKKSQANRDNNIIEINPSFDNLDSINISFNECTSICSMFLEPSKSSQVQHLEDMTNPSLESTITSSFECTSNKKLKLNCASNNLDENTFQEPKYTSSPHLSSSFLCKKRKIAKQSTYLSNFHSNSNEKVVKENDDKFDNSIARSNESVICESNPRNINTDKSPEKLTNFNTGTIPKTLKNKSTPQSNGQMENKSERISPASPESLPNSCSPEIMDSGYPNSNSPPDLSPEYDLSSIAHDQTSDSDSTAESPSIADAPRIGIFDMAQVENRDLANNNLDGEGNNVEAQANQHINDLRPLINVLENDIENENDIYVVRNGFPMWLLRMLQRFDADGVAINLPILGPPNENLGE